MKQIKKQFADLIPKDKHICLLGLQGSRGLGFPGSEQSDWDYRGIYIAKNNELLSLQKPKETIEVNDGLFDLVLHEVEKFFRLALKGNPSVISILFLPKYAVKDGIGDTIVANRHLFLSDKAIRNAFGGYAMSQILYLKRRHKFKDGKKIAKHIKHCFRLFDQGQELLETGDITFPLKDPQKYLDMAKIDDEQKWSELFEERDKEFRSCKSVLPEKPDTYLVNKLLLKIRNI